MKHKPFIFKHDVDTCGIPIYTEHPLLGQHNGETDDDGCLSIGKAFER